MKKGLQVFILLQSALPPSLAAVLALTEAPPELLEHAKKTPPASSAAETREEAAKGMRSSIGIVGPGYPMKARESLRDEGRNESAKPWRRRVQLGPAPHAMPPQRGSSSPPHAVQYDVDWSRS